MTRPRGGQVRTALLEHWGLTLHRGGEMGDGAHDGRWDAAYSKNGFVVGGEMPRGGHSYRRFATLSDVVTACDLAAVVDRETVGRVGGGVTGQRTVRRRRSRRSRLAGT